MRTTSLVVTGIAALVCALASCTDQAQPTAPSATRSVIAPASSISSGSSVCVAYIKKQMVAQIKLDNARNRNAGVKQLDQLQDETDKLSSISNEACN